MIKRTVLRKGLGIGVLTATSIRAMAQPDPSFLDWNFDFAGNAIFSGARHHLKNLSTQEILQYGKRTWGINLVWGGRKYDRLKVGKVMFEKPNPGSTKPAFGTIKFGEPVAIHILDGGYLKYEKRSFGVNLVWSTKPVYEWRLIGLGDTTSQINNDRTLGLYNTAARDFLVYKTQSVGINLGWWKDKVGNARHSEARKFIKMLRDRGFNGLANYLGNELR